MERILLAALLGNRVATEEDKFSGALALGLKGAYSKWWELQCNNLLITMEWLKIYIIDL